LRQGHEIVYDRESLQATCALGEGVTRATGVDRPLLEHSTEIDVDALFDGEDVLHGAVMQHVEEAGIHSGDSAC